MDEVRAWLEGHHGGAVERLASLDGGFWSSAFGYRVDGRELVLRLGTSREGYDADRAAMAFARPGLPIPSVLAVGDALGRHFAISDRARGRFLEEVDPGETEATGPLVAGLLGALASVAPAEPGDAVDWSSHTPAIASWKAWLRELLVDDPKRTVSGWRRKIEADAKLARLYRACERRIAALLDACPERRDLIHGDLLHQNVLVADDLSKINAVFSWKCSVRGDFLYDVAWFTFWAPWHPGIDALDLRPLVQRANSQPSDHVDAPQRHHCYELTIGTHHLGWYVWTGDAENLARLAERLEHLLERGPLPPAKTAGP